MEKRFILSQRIKGSHKEVFIINYESSLIEVQRTSNLYEPLIIRLNGELLDTIPSKQNKEIEFSTPTGRHKMQVWNERVENSLIPKIFVKDGIAVVLDGVPVQNTLADPITRFNTSKAFIWLLTILLFLKAFIIPLSSNQFFVQDKTKLFLFAYIILFILSLSAALTFRLNPIRAVWIALVVSVLELTDYIYAIIIIKEISIVVILFTVLRLSIFGSLIFALRNIKLVLNFSSEEYQSITQKPIIQKKVKRFSSPLKYIIISLISLIVLGGLYFGINEMIKLNDEPSIARDSSVEFRNDLKLPKLIPFRKGDKWGYCDSNKKIIIEPKYEEVNFFNEPDGTAVVKFNGLYGVIEDLGIKVTPFVYDELVGINYDNIQYYIAKQGRRFGVINSIGNTIIPFDYFDLNYFDGAFIASVYKGENKFFGILDISGNKKADFLFSEINIPSPLGDDITSLKDKSDIILVAKFSSAKSTQQSEVCMDISGKIVSPHIYSSILAKQNYIYCSTFDGLIDVFNYAWKGIISFKDPMYEVLSDSQGMQKTSKLGYYKREEYFDTKDYFNQDWYYLQDVKGIFCFPLNGLWGAIDSLGNTIIPHKYNFLYGFKANNDFYFKADTSLLLNSAGEVIISNDYKFSISTGNDFIITNKNNLKGILNIYGKEIFKPQYIDVRITPGNKFIVTYANEKEAVIDLNGHDIIPPKYDRIVCDSKGNYIVTFNEKSGVLDKNGRVIIPIKYDDISSDIVAYPSYSIQTAIGLPILYDLYIVSIGNKKGYVDLNDVEYFSEY